MKSFTDIYNSIINKFKSKTSLSIAVGSVLDKFFISTSYGILDAYQEIEDAKNPHIYTKLEGDNIDSVGLLVGCPRRENEIDSDYLYRMLNWNTSNQCGNLTAITDALRNMTYVSNAEYVPYVFGTGTAAVYIIPVSLDDDTIKKAINEVKERLVDVVSNSTYIEYIIPELLPVKFEVYFAAYKNEDSIKSQIEEAFEKYINGIAPGDKLDLGYLSNLGVTTNNVRLFVISNATINSKQLTDLGTIQKLESKFIFDSIIWKEVE